MKIVFKNSQVVSKALNVLLDQFQSTQLSAYSDPLDYETEAHKFLGSEEVQGEVKSEIKTVAGDFIPTDFNFDPAFSADSKFDFILGFENFVTVVKSIANNNSSTPFVYKGFERKAAPGLNVYQYIGHNKLDVKSDGINYQLLFK
ncbi:MAG: hypothetical protein QM764_20730 [Chitinophagaceae bacterium]